MKRVVEGFVSAVVISVGVELGTWLWEDTLKDKAKKLKERLKEMK